MVPGLLGSDRFRLFLQGFEYCRPRLHLDTSRACLAVPPLLWIRVELEALEVAILLDKRESSCLFSLFSTRAALPVPDLSGDQDIVLL